MSEAVFKSICRHCHGGCSALLHVDGNRLKKVRPAPGSPFNRGQMCVKGLATPELVHHPDRLLTPLERVGARGENRWREVDWDTALGAIAARLEAIRRETGPESVALGQGTGRHHYLHTVRFANQLGTPNWYEPGLANCYIPRITVSNLTYGEFVAGDYYGPVQPKTILFWGNNPLVSGPDGKLSFPIQQALDAGATGIAVDPRRSETARRCKLWLPLRPNTDAALALAMAHTIIEQGIYDREFVENWTTGFEELRAHVRPLTPAWAAGITGVPAEDIVAAARRYALDRPAVLEWGVAIEQHSRCLQTVRAVSLLRGLTGNLDVPGADVFGMHLVRPYPVLRDALPKGSFKKRIGGETYKLLGGLRAFMPSAHIPGLFRAMRTGEPYPVRALLLFGNNPLLTVADSRLVKESLLNLDLLVATDLFMTPSAALADYVLPAAAWPEINQIVELPFVAESAVAANRRALQVGACRQDEEIMIDLARRLELPGAEASLEDILNYRLEPLGITFDALCEQHMLTPERTYRRYRERGFRTPTRKVELYCRSLERLGYEALPSFEPSGPDPEAVAGGRDGFPYTLITGARRREFFCSEHRQIASLRRKRPDPVVELHPDTAAEAGVRHGEWAEVNSPQGRIRMRACVTEDIRPGVVSVDYGWWFPEKGPPEYGVWESNANVLTSAAPPYDPAFGSYQLRGLPCNIAPEK